MTEASHLLAMLRSHAARHGESRCHLLPDRVITYRRLWSRIERASARLQGEWGVQAGQTVAYVGSGHPDAIVLYGALLRIGASFLPLEGLPSSSVAALLDQGKAVLAVVDDELSLPASNSPASRSPTSRPLSQLLADWCHADPVVVEENPAARSLLLRSAAGGIDATSLLELTLALPDAPVSTRVAGPIFTVECLTDIILPALRDARVLHFDVKGQRLTGS